MLSMAFQSLYDENLSQNIFFRKIQREHKIIIDTAPLENWIICVPRSATIKPENLTNTDYLLAHILIPHDEIPEQYTNLLGVDVKQLNGKLQVRSVTSTILFEEIFYTKGLVKYKVWCIELPLLCSGNGSLNGFDNAPAGIFIVRGLQDAVALIWHETNSKAVFRKIESICCSFMKNTDCSSGLVEPSELNDNMIRKANLIRIKTSVEILLNHCFKKLLYQRRLHEKCSRDPHFKRVFKIALETYIMDLLHKWLFDAIAISSSEESEKFNKVLRNLTDTNSRDFKIETKYNDVIGRVRVEILKITDFTTPIEKISCLRRAVTAASQCKHNDISVDDLIPILVFVIIKSGLTHWIATLHFLKHFIFTEFSDGSDKGVDSFLITTMEAAIIYIQSIDFNDFKMNIASSFEQNGTAKNKFELQQQRRFATKDNFIEYLFAKIRSEDEVEIIKLLKTDKELEIVATDTKIAVSGANDDVLIKAIRMNGYTGSSDDDDIDEGVSDEIDVISKFPICRLNLQNRHGIGAIHVAAMHGLGKMLNLLLALGVNLNIRDENNYTPLHYAAARGHQNTLLLLLHAGADINTLTNDKNTALLLASNYGHSNCVKALLYYSDHMKVKIDRNSQNKFGDTAMHMASKWGFHEIIETLLEYGAKTDLRNRVGHTPLDFAHNSRITSLLENAFDLIDPMETSASSCDDSSSSSSSILSSTTSPTQNLEVFRGCFITSSLATAMHDTDTHTFAHKTSNDKIVAAIRNNDTKLACHFLGIELPDKITETVCHPLCDCEKCKHISEQLRYQSAMNQLTQTYDGDINKHAADGITPLQAAVQLRNCDLIEKIFQLGARVDTKSKTTQQTALHYAVLTKSIKVLDLVLNRIVDNVTDNYIDIPDSNGDTALHTAVRLGDTQLVAAILKYEPNVRLRNSDGKTPTDIAKSLLQLNMVRLLELAE